MKVNLSTQIKIIIYTAGGILALLIVGFFAVWPAVSEIKLINEQILAERKNLEKKYQQGQSLRQATEEYLAIKDDWAEILKGLVMKNEELEFITQLEALADTRQVKQEIKIGTGVEYNKDFAYRINSGRHLSKFAGFFERIRKLILLCQFFPAQLAGTGNLSSGC